MEHPLRTRILLVAALLPGSLSVSRASDIFVVDPVQSVLEFQLTHDGIVFVHGRFEEVGGVVILDPVDVDRSTLSVTVPLASVRANDPAVDEHLRGPGFFDTTKYPTASFSSTSLRMKPAGEFEVEGSLSLHGVTRPITFRFRPMMPGWNPGPGRCLAAEATLAIRCSDYGIRDVPEGIADEVLIVAKLVAIRKTLPGPSGQQTAEPGWGGP